MAYLADSPTVARVATYLRDHGPATLNKVAHTLELSRTSVENSVADLTHSAHVSDIGLTNGKGAGRPARSYRFNSERGFVAGVDVGVASTRVVIADLSGKVMTQGTYLGVGSIPGATAKLQAIIRNLEQSADQLNLRHKQIHAIGIALPGIVDDSGQVVASVVIPDWSGVDLASQVSQTFGCPVAIDNGVRLAAVAEHHIGVAQLVEDVLYLSVGYRIAAGMILSGRPRRGAHNIAGDIGRVAFRSITSGTGRILWNSADSAKAVFHQARQGNDASKAELARFIDELAQGIATLVMTIDPALIVIGGGVSNAEDELLAPLRQALREQTRLPFEIPVSRALLGADAASHGALVHAFSHYAEKVYGIPSMTVPRIQVLEDETRSSDEIIQLA